MSDPTVGATGSSNVAYGSQMPVGDVTNLTPDGLLIYCSTQLNDIDAQIGNFSMQQRQALREKQAIQNVATAFKKMNAGKGPQNPDDWNACIKAIRTAIDSLVPGDPTAQKLKDYLAGIDTQYPMHDPKDGEWQANIEELDKMSGAIGSEAELQMINLQSLVSRRATIVQLTTNIMSKLDQTAETIASKI